MNYLNNMCRV